MLKNYEIVNRNLNYSKVINSLSKDCEVGGGSVNACGTDVGA